METRLNKIFTITATIKNVLLRGFMVSIVKQVKLNAQLTSVGCKTQRMSDRNKLVSLGRALMNDLLGLKEMSSPLYHVFKLPITACG